MVSREVLLDVIKDQNTAMSKLVSSRDIIKRDLSFQVSSLAFGAAYIITGPRRSGKSVFSFQAIQGSKYGYVNFDDERLDIQFNELNRVLEAIVQISGSPEIIVLDEIQNVPGWEKFVSRIVVDRKVMITGSNSRLMSKELSTLMTGRHIDQELFPFSFMEFLAFKRITIPRTDGFTVEEKIRIMSNLEEYLTNGGFPLSIKLGQNFLVELFKDMVERDVIQRYNIRMKSKLKDLARYLISNSSTEISYNRLRIQLRISGKSTIQNWIMYLQNSYLIFTIERFSFKLKESIMAPKKVYCVDTGLINAFTNNYERGKIIENAFFLFLLRTKAYTDRVMEINYWKDHTGREVDFVLRHGRSVFALINVSYATLIDNIREREINSLIRASVELNCRNLIIITWDYLGEISNDGKTIRCIPLWRWLLNQSAALS